MNNVGMGVLIQSLGGNAETVAAFHASVGKEIESVQVVDNELIFKFRDGATLVARDEGQSCCERRYMTCDDDLPYYEGAALQNLEIKEGPTENDECGEPHEIQFLEVTTSKGQFTVASHNEHNGYYGGFWITLSAAR